MIEVRRIIKNNEKNTIYTGYTSDLTKRITQHRENKGARYTRGEKKIKLLYTESFTDRSEAMRREIEIKKLSRQEKLELVRNYSSLPFSKKETED